MTSTPIEPVYVVDTNALLWYLLDDRKLSSRGREVFLAAEQGQAQILVSAIAIAELFYADRKWGFFEDFEVVYQALKAQPYFEFIPFDADHVLDFVRDEAVPEMHDRIITGLAYRHNAPIISSDPEIAASELVQVVW